MSLIHRILKEDKTKLQYGLKILPNSIRQFMEELALIVEVYHAAVGLVRSEIEHKTASPPRRAEILAKDIPLAHAKLVNTLQAVSNYRPAMVSHKTGWIGPGERI